MCRRRPLVRAPHRARCGAGLRSTSRLRLPPHRGESGKFCASSSANLLAFVCDPPWAWIDGNPVLTELHVEYGLACTARFGNGGLGSAAHYCDGLARYHAAPSRVRQDFAGGTGIKDQELTIIVSMIC